MCDGSDVTNDVLDAAADTIASYKRNEAVIPEGVPAGRYRKSLVFSSQEGIFAAFLVPAQDVEVEHFAIYIKGLMRDDVVQYLIDKFTQGLAKVAAPAA